MRLALFDPSNSSLKDLAVTAPGNQMLEVDSDGGYVVWIETKLGELDARGWKVSALDLKTGERWGIASDSGVEFRPRPLPQYFPDLSLQGGRLAYSVLTTDPSGKPAYELRVVDLMSRDSVTILGPLDAQKTSLYALSLYSDTLVWVSNTWEGNTVVSRDLWKMHLPDGKPAVLDSGDIGYAPTVYKSSVIYDKGPDSDFSASSRLIYILDLETGEKRQVSTLRQVSSSGLHLTDRFVYWTDPDAYVGTLVDLQTGKAVSLGTERVRDVFPADGRAFWSRVEDAPSGRYSESRVYIEWADLPQ